MFHHVLFCWVPEEGFVTPVYDTEMFKSEKKRLLLSFLSSAPHEKSRQWKKCRSPRFILSFGCTQRLDIINLRERMQVSALNSDQSGAQNWPFIFFIILG